MSLHPAYAALLLLVGGAEGGHPRRAGRSRPVGPPARAARPARFAAASGPGMLPFGAPRPPLRPSALVRLHPLHPFPVSSPYTLSLPDRLLERNRSSRRLSEKAESPGAVCRRFAASRTHDASWGHHTGASGSHCPRRHAPHDQASRLCPAGRDRRRGRGHFRRHIHRRRRPDDGGGAARPQRGRRHPQNSAAPASTGTWVGTWSASPAGAEPGTETERHGGPLRAQRRAHQRRRHERPHHAVQPLRAAAAHHHARLDRRRGRAPTAPPPRPAPCAASPSAAAPRSSSRPAQQVHERRRARCAIPHDADVLVTTYSPTPSGPVTYHPHARQISYVAEGDRAEDVTGTAYTEQTPYWRYVTAARRAEQRVGRHRRRPRRLPHRRRHLHRGRQPPLDGRTSRTGCATQHRRRGPLQRRQPGHQRKPHPGRRPRPARRTTRAACPASTATSSTVRTSRPSSSTSASTTSCATRTRTTPTRSPTGCAS